MGEGETEGSRKEIVVCGRRVGCVGTLGRSCICRSPRVSVKKWEGELRILQKKMAS